ncbi:MAG: hypothetical protein BZ137_09920 [Methanosphaera sp. rholeuAM130]|nr:MAG: hypothetical protein BZ137_09920 [Methanosphaera sp. rholeuAM130]
MFKIVLDYSYWRALLRADDENHEVAELITPLLSKDYTFYTPFHVFRNVMMLCDNEDVRVKKEIHYYIDKCTRIQFYAQRYTYDDIYEYLTSDNDLSFDDSLTLGFMKKRGIRVIVSFNEAFDQIRGINRIYALDEYNPRILNFFKYVQK